VLLNDTACGTLQVKHLVRLQARSIDRVASK
jgi:hypothetical protein